MNVTLISIGDELLSGRTVNTNASWLGVELSSLGHTVDLVLTIPDKLPTIRSAIEDATGRSDCVIVTGGLGPTEDDLTREAVCALLDCDIVVSDEQMELNRERFERLGRTMNQRNINQARIPAASRVLPNNRGTAPGLAFRLNDADVFVLPGVPTEMRGLFTEFIAPHIGTADGFSERVWLLYGIPESILADTLEPVTARLNESVGLAYLPSEGTIRLRLVLRSADPETILLGDELAAQLEELAGEWILSRHNETIGAAIGRELAARRLTIATAESCTGGMIGAELTSVPGSSEYYLGGAVSYADDVKEHLLGVPAEILREHGAVSEPVVLRMATGVRERTGADISMAVTGIAGPGGGSEEKPVGTVWIAVATEAGVSAQMFNFRGERDIVRRYSTNAALAMAFARMIDEYPAVPSDIGRTGIET